MKHLIIIALVVTTLAGAACSRAPQHDQYGRPSGQWGQSYTSPQGQVMQPAHGWFYYFVMYHFLFSQASPTYHPAVPYLVPSLPPAPMAPRLATPPTLPGVSPSPSPRSSGGFSTPPTPKPSSPPAFRSSGGFSAPTPTPRPSTPSPSFRSSGGFSSGGKR